MTIIPKIRMVQDNQITVTVGDITDAIDIGYTAIYIYEDTDSGGTFTTQNLSITLVANTTEYTVYDPDGTASTYYKAALYGAGVSPTTTSKSDFVQSGKFADNAYCSSFDVRQEFAAGGGTANASSEKYGHIIWEMIVQASRLIDRFKGVEPGSYRAETSETRTYRGTGTVRQPIDHYVSVSAVAVDETASGSYTSWTSSDYDTWPENAAAMSESIRRLDVNDTSNTTKSIWTKGARRVQVTGVPGITSAPPDEISRACRIMASRWYKRAQQAWQDASANAELGQMLYVKKLDPDVQTILAAAFPHKGVGV